jgi:hypothetical protein
MIQKRHFKDPELVRSPHTVAMTDAEFEQLNRAAKIAGQTKGEFIAKMVNWYLDLCQLRKDQQRA